MRKTTSIGDDDIPADLFISALPYMLPAITHIYNLSLSQAYFLPRWKISKLSPLFKGSGSKQEPSQYRPVALLSPASRLLEKIVCDQVMEYLYSNELLHSSNHGYRRGYGTTTAVLETYQAALDAV